MLAAGGPRDRAIPDPRVLGGGAFHSAIDTVSTSPPSNATRLAVGLDQVYWAGSLGGISFAPLEGGPATAVQGGGIAGAIAIGSASVYWTSEPSLLRAGLGSNYGQVLRDGVSQITGVGVDDAYVYYGSDSETGVSLTRIAR